MSVHTPQTHETRSIADSDTFTLAHSVVELESGPAGTIVRIDHADGHTDFAGPIDAATAAALREVSR